MSRSNPYKKKRRSAKTTLLVFGEGLGEEMFLKHLKRIYAYNTDVAVTIKKGKGGTADAVVIDAAKTDGAYDRKVVILDNDKSQAEMSKARREAKARDIELIENSPCLEALLLSVLLPGEDFQDRTSAWCKKNFETNYINKKKRVEPSEYERVFPKTLLESCRREVPGLQKIVLLMENR